MLYIFLNFSYLHYYLLLNPYRQSSILLGEAQFAFSSSVWRTFLQISGGKCTKRMLLMDKSALENVQTASMVFSSLGFCLFYFPSCWLFRSSMWYFSSCLGNTSTYGRKVVQQFIRKLEELRCVLLKYHWQKLVFDPKCIYIKVGYVSEGDSVPHFSPLLLLKKFCPLLHTILPKVLGFLGCSIPELYVIGVKRQALSI